MSNQFNLPQVNSNQGVETSERWSREMGGIWPNFNCHSKGSEYLCKCDISIFPFYKIFSDFFPLFSQFCSQLYPICSNVPYSCHRNSPVGMARIGNPDISECSNSELKLQFAALAHYATEPQHFLFNKCTKISEILFSLCHYGVLSVDWWLQTWQNVKNMTKCEKCEGVWILSECTVPLGSTRHKPVYQTASLLNAFQTFRKPCPHFKHSQMYP